MHARLDASFETWATFPSRVEGEGRTGTPGRLTYSPDTGIKLELIGPACARVSPSELDISCGAYTGCLIDGTPVTLLNCLPAGAETGYNNGVSITHIVADRLIVGRHVTELQTLPVRRYSMELSLVSGWLAPFPAVSGPEIENGEFVGELIRYRRPTPIVIPIAGHHFAFHVEQSGWSTREAGMSNCLALKWSSEVAVVADPPLPFAAAERLAWRARCLLALLIGQIPHENAIVVDTVGTPGAAVPDCHMQVVQQPRGTRARSELHPAQIRLPYSDIIEALPKMVHRWFERTTQAELAGDIFFGAQLIDNSSLEVRFLLMMQAAESYHRSLPGAGRYPLRTRMWELLNRLPDPIRLQLAEHPDEFVSAIVHTRNYFTHYDEALQRRTLIGKDVFVAAERLRFILEANMLLDIGVVDEGLSDAMRRSVGFKHWTTQELRTHARNE